MQYIDFASKVSFYEFLQNEFKKPHFNTTKYKEEIKLLKNKISIEYLTKILEAKPKIIDIFEEIFQLKRFTNAQYINFCFDVNVLNNSEEDLVIKYIENRIFKFENGIKNDNFLNIYKKLFNKTIEDNQITIFQIKRTIIDYIDICLRKRDIFYSHLVNSIDSRLRLAKYLIENLSVESYLLSINLENFLASKRHPIDTKSLHGNFGIKKVVKILDENNFINVDDSIHEKILERDNAILKNNFNNQFCYLRERAINGIYKSKDKKPKIFDFILCYNGIPKVLIETNFYTTTGTKIGINQGEYVDLLEDINKFNANQNMKYKFIWISDGNYWLTKDGENRFENLKRNYFKGEFELQNYNLFKENIDSIKKEMQNE